MSLWLVASELQSFYLQKETMVNHWKRERERVNAIVIRCKENISNKIGIPRICFWPKHTFITSKIIYMRHVNIMHIPHCHHPDCVALIFQMANNKRNSLFCVITSTGQYILYHIVSTHFLLLKFFCLKNRKLFVSDMILGKFQLETFDNLYVMT